MEELDNDDDGMLLQEKDNIEDVGKWKNQENKSAAGTFPVIEHPDDQSDECANKSSSMELSQRIDENKMNFENKEVLSTRHMGGSDKIQLRIDPIHEDLDDEIFGLRKKQ